MARTLDTSTAAALITSPLYEVWFVRLDVVGDPVYINTSLHNITFPGGSGYDPAIVGFLFTGIANLGSIDAVTDSVDGSQTVTLTLPGVQLANDYLHQIINNADLWQRRNAYIWMATFDNTGALVGKPFRVKTGRMDKMPITIDPDSGTGTIQLQIESQASYSGEALNTRYVDQPIIDSSDTSQRFVSDLANKVPAIGNPTSNASGTIFGGAPVGISAGRGRVN